MSNVYVAIMAGGIGSRFWPLSRTAKPKQFLDVMNTGKSLLQITYERSLKIAPSENIFIVTAAEYEHLVSEQLPELSSQQILLEPYRKNTAPAIAYVSGKIHAKNPNAIITVVPSDHLILLEEKFCGIINQCIQFAQDNEALITLGIKPYKPATGYGYIQFNEESGKDGFFQVKTFTEKPDLEIAKTFLKSGDFLWNSGMFIWKAKDILDALHKYLPDVGDCFDSNENAYFTDKEKEFVATAYSQCTNISIDYGVMEKAKNVYTISANFGWSDIGTWDSLYENYEKDYLGNAVKGSNVKVYDASNNMIVAQDGKLVVIQGIEKLCVIDTKDVLLICERSQEQEIKNITLDLKQADLDKYL
ncbi:MAG TPA: mannose-1-phosphate guanylyltransferase [Chitinophagales bacterium]